MHFKFIVLRLTVLFHFCHYVMLLSIVKYYLFVNKITESYQIIVYSYLRLENSLKLISSIPLKNLHFVCKRHISRINKNLPGGNFASGVVWHTIVFKVSAFRGRGIPVIGSKTN